MSIKKSLEALFEEVFTFTKKDFHLLSYLYTLIFISICTYFNYSTRFYGDVMQKSYISGNSLWTYPVFYGLIYFSVAIPVLLLQKDYKTVRKGKFYTRSLFFVTLYGLASGYYGYRNWEFPTLFNEEKQFIFQILSQLEGSVFFILPLFLLKTTIDKQIVGLYGLARNTKHIGAYLILFAMLLPFLIAISFMPDFKEAYPQFRPWLYDDIFGWSSWISTLLFETTYSLDFIMTELIFRGALVIGMTCILGRKAVLPMVGLYVAIHFGKPMGETISSIFGGYILGALAYQTQHIWGGVIIHICLAITMEVMGFVHFYVLKQ